LAELPPLPVVRSQLLGVLQAPAGKLVRTIAEPARSLAAVFQAYADKARPPRNAGYAPLFISNHIKINFPDY
jgi:large subunit ribosomal protein L10